MNLVVQGLCVATKEIIKRKALEGAVAGIMYGGTSVLAAHMMKKLLTMEKENVNKKKEEKTNGD